MFRTFACLAVIASAITFTTSVSAQEQTQAQASAAAMQGTVGQTFEGGVTIKSVTAEDDMLIVTVTGPDNWSAGMSPADVSDALIKGFCGSAPQAFDAGMTVRVDAIDKGTATPGPVVNACPAKTES